MQIEIYEHSGKFTSRRVYSIHESVKRILIDRYGPYGEVYGLDGNGNLIKSNQIENNDNWKQNDI